MKIEWYERTKEQEDDLGISDMKVEGYEGDPNLLMRRSVKVMRWSQSRRNRKRSPLGASIVRNQACCVLA
jgi:hypothetical protein